MVMTSLLVRWSSFDAFQDFTMTPRPHVLNNDSLSQVVLFKFTSMCPSSPDTMHFGVLFPSKSHWNASMNSSTLPTINPSLPSIHPSLGVVPTTPPFICPFSLFPLHTLLHIENGTAAWVSGNERWTRGVPACDPSGDNIVAELGSEMTKNGNIVSDSDSSNAQLEIRTYGSSRGP